MKLNLFNAAMMAAFLRPKWRLIDTVTLEDAAASVAKTYTTPYRGFKVLVNTAAYSSDKTGTITLKSGENTVTSGTISGMVDTSAKYAIFQGWIDMGLWRVLCTSSITSESTSSLSEVIDMTPATEADYSTCDGITIEADNIPATSVFKIYGLR